MTDFLEHIFDPWWIIPGMALVPAIFAFFPIVVDCYRHILILVIIVKTVASYQAAEQHKTEQNTRKTRKIPALSRLEGGKLAAFVAIGLGIWGILAGTFQVCWGARKSSQAHAGSCSCCTRHLPVPTLERRFFGGPGRGTDLNDLETELDADASGWDEDRDFVGDSVLQ
eukprot:CAMPEP_0206475246 /NCGR_PEP_ID=MMETSP0324_2-20121206/33962_1 /ASSEMBLY_ACC=CAM_ASM_000836 /TAXON_ID=2866 /ORGANISM="Crypthecodinium cohnii, Strain Seligo" /LENGTH=168 /DNA_ID=CAMNT_0053950561 /DNA_START=274 /DNA_END=777 /DNA_ORIENTATION=+